LSDPTTTNRATADAIAAQIIDCYLPCFQQLRIRLFGSRAMGREQFGLAPGQPPAALRGFLKRENTFQREPDRL